MGRVGVEDIGRGGVLWSALAGVLAGGALGAAAYFGPPGVTASGLSAPAIYAAAFAIIYCFLVEGRDRARPLVAALGLAAIVAAPVYFTAIGASDPTGRRAFAPTAIWFLLAAPAGAYLLAALIKAYALRHGASEADGDAAFFLHVLTLPLLLLAAALLITPAAAVFALGAMAMGPKAAALVAAGAPYAHFAAPVAGGLIGLAIGLMRARTSALGALRFVSISLARLATPAIAVAAVTLLGLSIASGPWLAFRTPYPSAALIASVATIWLAFNGVRQSGHGGPPPLWLRAPTIVSLLVAPAFAWFALKGLLIRIDVYGLTPLRILGLGAATIALAHATAGVVSVAGEAFSRSDRWMPLTSKLNAGLAALTAIALLGAGTPLFDPFGISAKDQERRLISGRVDAEAFDYAFLRFSLGEDGAAALDRLQAAVDHPQSATIRANVDLVRRFESRSSYEAYLAGPGQGETADDEDDWTRTAPDDRWYGDALPDQPQDRPDDDVDPESRQDGSGYDAGYVEDSGAGSAAGATDELPLSPSSRD